MGQVVIKKLHPTSTARKNTVNGEPGWVNCKQCGFPIKLSRHSKGSGYGNKTYSDITTDAGGTANVSDPTVNDGCPFCGTSEYE